MPRSVKRKKANLALKILAVLFAGLVVLFALAAWRLSSGPISIGFLGPYLEDSFSSPNSDYTITFSDTILSWEGWDRSLDILAVEMKVFNSDGQEVAHLPRVSIGLSALSLLSGDLNPTNIEILAPDIRLARNKSGHIVFDSGNPKELEEGVLSNGSDFSYLMEQFISDRKTEGSRLGGLDSVAIRNADISLEDHQEGLKWRVPKADFVFELGSEEATGKANFYIETIDKLINIDTNIDININEELIKLEIGFEDFVPLNVKNLVEFFPTLSNIDGSFSGKVYTETNFNGDFKIPLIFDIEGYSGIIDMPSFIPTPRPFEYLRIKGQADIDNSTLNINDFFVDSGGPTFSFNGNITETKKGYGIIGDLSIIDMPFDELYKYWPDTLLVKTRTWVLKNVSEGIMTRFTSSISLEPGQFPLNLENQYIKDAVTAEFEFENISVNYLKPMPLVKGVNGNGKANMHTMFIEMREGSVDGVKTKYAQANFWDLTGESKPHASMTIQTESSIQDAIKLINSGPLTINDKVNISLENLNGEINTNFTLGFPVDYGISVKDVNLNALAQARSVSADNFLSKGYNLSNGDFEIQFSDNKLRLEGVGAINDVPIDIEWSEKFTSNGSSAQNYIFKTILDTEGRESLGFNLSSHLNGPVKMDVSVSRNVDKAYQAIATIDLSSSELKIPEIYWKKEYGDGAAIKMIIDFGIESKEVNISELEFNAKDLYALGNLKLGFDENNKFILDQAEFARVLYGDNDLSFNVDNKIHSLPIIKITGESLDLRPFLDDFLDEDKDKISDFILDININRLITRSNQQLTAVRGSLESISNKLKAGRIYAVLPSGHDMTLMLDSQGQKRRIKILSEDAGAFARAFDIFDDVIGGKLFIWAIIHDDQSPPKVSGEVNVSNYRIINTPLLAQILNIASLTGIVELLQGDGIAFGTLVVPFEKNKNILTLKRARALGTSLGVHADGNVNLKSDIADIEGTIAPAYVINSFISNIPIIGEVLAGGKGEGLFAATYTIRGSLDAPTIIVNPLAALTPGFLRNIFSVFEEGGLEPDFDN